MLTLIFFFNFIKGYANWKFTAFPMYPKLTNNLIETLFVYKVYCSLFDFSRES